MEDHLRPGTTFCGWRRQFENDSVSRRSAVVGRAVEIASWVKIQITLRTQTVSAAGKAVEDGFGPNAAFPGVNW